MGEIDGLWAEPEVALVVLRKPTDGVAFYRIR